MNNAARVGYAAEPCRDTPRFRKHVRFRWEPRTEKVVQGAVIVDRPCYNSGEGEFRRASSGGSGKDGTPKVPTTFAQKARRLVDHTLSAGRLCRWQAETH